MKAKQQTPENIKQAFRELMQEPEWKDWIRQELMIDPVDTRSEV